ncbi:RagB/SusD family nutrient uptake outer membrane protein [Parapedobacter deserti]|uniref:RagB/SusD family nutrient uptake outer membrane protein n=1 Tax=Parapedobacter deserti TaxID=1912957 RepID=A0ABV7JQR6_9SPHI
MKTNIIYILFFATLCFSCDRDFLKEDPRSVLNPVGFYTDEAGLRAGVNATYAALRPMYGEQEAPFQLTLLGTDLFTHGKAEIGLPFDYYDADLNSFSGEVAFIWNNCYNLINIANSVVSSAPEVQMNEVEKNHLVGEARFIRALAYFWLVQQFSDVPLRLEPTMGVVREVKRNSKDEVYKAIIADLVTAEANLGDSHAQWGRVRKGAARHLLSKVYLTIGDWENAFFYADKVIADKSNYGLEATFSDIFHHDNQVNKEVVFSVQYRNDLVNSGIGNRTHLFFTNSYSDIPGMQRELQWGRPWSRYAPTAFLMSLFDDESDERTDIWRTFDDFYYNNPSSLPDGKSLGDPIDPSWENTIEFHPALIKYWDPTRPQVNEERGNKDFIVFRLAETYLIAAEALLMDGKRAAALPYFNAVRQRASREGYDLSVTEEMLDVDLILDERARELAGEMHRWFDLVRTGKAVERIRLYSKNGANIQPHHLLRPIPQNEIDLLETPLPQNDGY